MDIPKKLKPTGLPDPALLSLIRNTDRNCVIIFIAENADHALWGYSFHSFDYWVKPLSKCHVTQSINDAVTALHGKSQDILRIKGKGFNTPVRHTNIIYMESVKHHVKIHMQNGNTFRVYGKLDDYEATLHSSSLFLRCHQSFLVNMAHVDGISGRDFIMKGGSRIPIRKSTCAQLKQVYYHYIIGNRSS